MADARRALPLLRGARSLPGIRSPRPLTGALFAAVVIAHGSSSSVWLDLIFVAALVAITRIDLEQRHHSQSHPRSAGRRGARAHRDLRAHQLPERLIAAAAAGGVLFLIVLAYPKGMGMGDAKLLAVMGLVLGRSVAPALLVALIAGTLVGVVVMAKRGVARGPAHDDPVRSVPGARWPGRPVRRSRARQRLSPRGRLVSFLKKEITMPKPAASSPSSAVAFAGLAESVARRLCRLASGVRGPRSAALLDPLRPACSRLSRPSLPSVHLRAPSGERER